MPPRLPTTTTTSALARTLTYRPFSSTSALALPPREPSYHASHASHASPASDSSHRLASLSGGGPPPGGVRHKRGEAAQTLIERYKTRARDYVREKSAQMEFLRNQKISNDYLKQVPRRWEAGDVYSPHDLSPVEMQKWRKRSLRNNDVVDALGISPLDMYKNFSLIEHFTTPSGMIQHSKVTQLRPVNQRKVAKMIRRVQGMGIYPSVHAHPEMLREQFFQRF